MAQGDRRRPPFGYEWVNVTPTTRVLLPSDTNYLENYASNLQNIPEIHIETPENEYIRRENNPFALPYSMLLQRFVSRQCELPLIMPANNSIVVTFDGDRTIAAAPAALPRCSPALWLSALRRAATQG